MTNLITNTFKPNNPINGSIRWSFLYFFVFLSLSFVACSAKPKMPGDGIFAKIETDKGDILAQLEFEKVPLTVMNFVGLAEGRFDAPNAPEGKHYFDGLSFHRVEPGFVIQGGDPQGNGSGGPGYEFPNEIVAELNHDNEGVLSMANAGPDTNGSQFFITLASAPFLNGAYSVFGHVVEGMDVVKNIAQGDKMNTVTIIRQGAKAKAFQPTWAEFQALAQKMRSETEASNLKFAEGTRKTLEDFAREQWSDLAFSKGADGLEVYIAKEGDGPNGVEIGNVKEYKVHYTLWTPSEDGGVNKADSSVDRGEPIEVSPEQVIRAWGESLPQMQVGERRIMLVPSELGYGSQGSPPVIQPNSYLLFEMEMLGFVP